jgi:hypothetical protein
MIKSLNILHDFGTDIKVMLFTVFEDEEIGFGPQRSTTVSRESERSRSSIADGGLTEVKHLGWETTGFVFYIMS